MNLILLLLGGGEMKEIIPNKDPEYLIRTEKCPLCFGRGRVCKENYEFEEWSDTYKHIYEEEKAIEEVESILGQ